MLGGPDAQHPEPGVGLRRRARPPRPRRARGPGRSSERRRRARRWPPGPARRAGVGQLVGGPRPEGRGPSQVGRLDEHDRAGRAAAVDGVERPRLASRRDAEGRGVVRRRGASAPTCAAGHRAGRRRPGPGAASRWMGSPGTQRVGAVGVGDDAAIDAGVVQRLAERADRAAELARRRSRREQRPAQGDAPRRRRRRALLARVLLGGRAGAERLVGLERQAGDLLGRHRPGAGAEGQVGLAGLGDHPRARGWPGWRPRSRRAARAGWCSAGAVEVLPREPGHGRSRGPVGRRRRRRRLARRRRREPSDEQPATIARATTRAAAARAAHGEPPRRAACAR